MRILLSISVLLCSLLLTAQKSEATYGNHRIGIAPFSHYGSAEQRDIGVGLAYERFLSEHLALQADLAYGFQKELRQVSLGPKLYFTGHDKPVSYALAPVFVFTQMKQEYDPLCFGFYPGSCPPEVNEYSQFGFMLINSVNMTLNERVYFGIEAGLGVNYLNSYTRDDGYESENDPASNGMFRISMGYRF